MKVLGSFSISALNHVFGSRAISVEKLLFDSSNWRAPTILVKCTAVVSVPVALNRFQPSTVTGRLNGTHTIQIPFLPSGRCRLGRARKSLRYLGGVFLISNFHSLWSEQIHSATIAFCVSSIHLITGAWHKRLKETQALDLNCVSEM